jgi:RND family efflux transporter MFP subunit
MNLRKLSSLLLASGLSAFAAEIAGYTEPYRIITVSAAEPGVIAEVLVKEGDAVNARQVLARLDTAVLDAELDIARVEAELAGTKLARVQELARASRATPEEADRAKADLAIKNAQVRRIEAQIESRTLRSPVAGVVTEIKRDPSESVSVANAHVLTVVQIDQLAVNLFLSPERAAALRTGAEVMLALQDPPQRVPAKIEFISPITDSASGTVRVKFVIDNAGQKIRSGAPCLLAE